MKKIASKVVLIARKPMRVPIQKFWRKANLAGRPYSPHGRRSILAMMRAEIAVRRKMAASLIAVPMGVSDASPKRGGRCNKKCAANTISRPAAASRPAMIPRKISARQPARIPFGPRKTLFVGAGGETSGCGAEGSGGWFIAGSDMQLIYAKTRDEVPSRLDSRCAKIQNCNSSKTSPIKLNRELKLPRIIGCRSLTGIRKERTDRSHIVPVGNVEHVGDQLQVEALGEVDSFREPYIVENGPGLNACIAAQIAIERQQGSVEVRDARFLENSGGRILD